MKISLKNIGKIKDASVEIAGITVIGGANGTGKSTVGKALFALYNSQFNIDSKIKNDRIQSIVNFVKSNFFTSNGKFNLTNNLLLDFAETLVSDIETYSHSDNLIKEELQKTLEKASAQENKKNIVSSKSELYSNMDLVVLQLRSILLIPDNEIIQSFLQKYLDSEFRGQIANINDDEYAQIDLCVNNSVTTIRLNYNGIMDFTNVIPLHDEVIYIDDPYMLDLFEFNQNDELKEFHRVHLKSKFKDMDSKEKTAIEEILLDKKLDNFNKIINDVCPGSVIKTKDNVLNYKTLNENNLNFTNLSSGLKSFAIIKTLIKKGIIKNNGTIILDEPEIHLHPEWQLVYAQLIVLLNKEFGIHILLNTHSPYFLRAIQVYAAKYSVADKCKYYLSEIEDNYAVIKDVSNNIDNIYTELSKPLQTLSDLEGE